VICQITRAAERHSQRGLVEGMQNHISEQKQLSEAATNTVLHYTGRSDTVKT
jgi:hypothetical protein